MKTIRLTVGDDCYEVNWIKDLRKRPSLFKVTNNGCCYEIIASFRSEELAEEFVDFLEGVARAKRGEERDVTNW